jgi:predicted nicotinamide N-methyase
MNSCWFENKPFFYSPGNIDQSKKQKTLYIPTTMAAVCTELVVRRDVTYMEEAISLIASGMPQGDQLITVPCGSAETEDSCAKLEINVINFPFETYGIGGVTWKAAVVLAHHIASKEYNNQYDEVIELGCGTAALGGLACLGCIGNCTVTLTDFPDVLRLTKKTISRNLELVNSKGGHVKYSPLLWGQDLPASVEARGYDLVLGADIIYMSNLHSALLETLKSICLNSSKKKNKTTRVLLSFKSRHPTEEKKFFDIEAPRYGFKVTNVDISDLTIDGCGCPDHLIKELHLQQI